jgi:hypothetical protein
MNFPCSNPYEIRSRYFHVGPEENHKSPQVAIRNGGLPNTHLGGSHYTSLLDECPFVYFLFFLSWFCYSCDSYFSFSSSFNSTSVPFHLLRLIILSLTVILMLIRLFLIPPILFHTSKSWLYSSSFHLCHLWDIYLMRYSFHYSEFYPSLYRISL